MKTIQLVSPGKFRLLDEPEPRASPGEALVRTHCIGLCGTDIHAYQGNQPFFQYPRLLGHELGVEILEIEETVLGLNPGDRCSVEPYSRRQPERPVGPKPSVPGRP